MKHHLTGDTMLNDLGVLLHRIRAAYDIPAHGVRAGDIGGWVDSPDRITLNGWITDDAQAYDDATITGAALVSENARIYESATSTKPPASAAMPQSAVTPALDTALTFTATSPSTAAHGSKTLTSPTPPTSLLSPHLGVLARTPSSPVAPMASTPSPTATGSAHLMTSLPRLTVPSTRCSRT